jgi:hypothetical protein
VRWLLAATRCQCAPFVSLRRQCPLRLIKSILFIVPFFFFEFTLRIQYRRGWRSQLPCAASGDARAGHAIITLSAVVNLIRRELTYVRGVHVVELTPRFHEGVHSAQGEKQRRALSRRFSSAGRPH